MLDLLKAEAETRNPKGKLVRQYKEAFDSCDELSEIEIPEGVVAENIGIEV